MAREVIKFTTPVFRVAYAHPFKATAMEGGAPKFGLTAIWTPANFSEKDKVLWRAIGAALDDATMRAFKKHWKDLKAPYKPGVRDGDDTEDRAAMDGFGPGTKFANMTSNFAVGCVDVEKNDISPEEGNADEIYSGCYGRATVTVYSYDIKGGKGVALGIRSFQKIKDGERLDARGNAANDFGDDIDESWLEANDDDGPVDASTEFPDGNEDDIPF